MVKTVAALGALCLIPHLIYCQEQPDRLSSGAAADSPNLALISFDRFLDTYQWDGRTSYRAITGNLSFSLSEQFLSTIIRTDRNRITDRQQFDLSARYRLGEQWKAAAQASSFILSDNRSIGISNVSYNAVYGGVEYRPFTTVTILPLIGLRFENQIDPSGASKSGDQRDRGVSYLINLSSDSLEYEGYRTQIGGRLQYDKLTPRILESRNINLNAEKVFFERTRNRFQFSYSRNRRDFYSPVDEVTRQQFNVSNNIETRSEDAFAIADSLDYGMGDKLLLTLQGNLFTREIDRETRYRSYSAGKPVPNTTIGELRIGGAAQLGYHPGKYFDGFVQFAFQERDENHRVQPDDSLSQSGLAAVTRLEERKNNQARRTTLASAMTFTPLNAHTITISGSASLLRYDTPSADNDDDRDELWYIANVTTHHRINRHLQLRVSADVNLTHRVYISSKRSADNTWNRIFRISPRLEYNLSGEIRSENIFEVLANYTAYDFEYPASPIRSFVFRQLGFIDSTTMTITRRLRLDLFGQWRIYERGELQWDSFTERPVNYFEDRTYSAVVGYALSRSLLFSAGIRYFSQLRFGYAGSERIIESFLRSSGPITSIVWNVSGRTEFSIQGWYEQQSQTGTTKRSFTNMTMFLRVQL
ncbi:MAG TPA: hypothetical protein VGR15_00830 [Bacteroidota bacterium]|nr:hypothetical protein [Bacteroidota bacterium]